MNFFMQFIGRVLQGHFCADSFFILRAKNELSAQKWPCSTLIATKFLHVSLPILMNLKIKKPFSPLVAEACTSSASYLNRFFPQMHLESKRQNTIKLNLIDFFPLIEEVHVQT
jgi:hypothetical protein